MLKSSEAENEEIQVNEAVDPEDDVVAVHVHICRSGFPRFTYQLNAEMYITGLQRTLLQVNATQSHPPQVGGGVILNCIDFVRLIVFNSTLFQTNNKYWQDNEKRHGRS